MRGKPRMDIYCTLITTKMVEAYLHQHLYVKNGSPVKNVGYESGLANTLRKKICHFIVKAVGDVRNRSVNDEKLEKKNEKKSFFTLGSIYSTDGSGPRKCAKTKIQIKLNRVKNTNWSKVNQLAIYKRGRGFELRTTENNFS